MSRLRSFAKALAKSVLGDTATARLAQEYSWWARRWVKTPHGFWFVGHPHMQTGEFEMELAGLMKAIFAERDALVDVGANAGYYTCLACSLGKAAIAFEPMPNNLRYLKANLRKNGWEDRVSLHEMAVGDAPGTFPMHGDGLGASLVKGWGGTPPGWRRNVRVDRLDSAVRGELEGKRVLFKIDVEGAEYAAIRGAAQWVARNPKPAWIVEITQDLHRPGRNPSVLDTFKFFWENGYETRTAESRPRTMAPEQIEIWIREGRLDSIGTNWLFVERGWKGPNG